MIDLQYFADTVPDKVTRSRVVREIKIYNLPFKTERLLKAYAEHDALHYLSGHYFTLMDEGHIAYLEKIFNRGWLPYGKKYNPNFPRECEYNGITVEKIDEVADILMGIYDDYVDKWDTF
jgi:hypothetical protein